MDETASYNWATNFDLNIRLMRKLGLWPEGRGSYKPGIYMLYAVFMVTFFPAYHILAQVVEIFFVSDLESAVGIIYIVIFESVASVKIYFTITRVGFIKKCMEHFKADWFQPRNQEQKLNILENFKIWKLVHKLLQFSCYSCTFFWFLPLLLGEREKLPFVAWFPFDYGQSPHFELVYIYQILSTIYLCIVHLTVDTTIFGFNVCIGCQLDMLSDNLRKFTNISDCYGNCNPEKNLVKCVIHHKQILKFVESCRQFYELILFWHLILSGTAIGITMFQLTLLKPLTSDFFSILLYVFGISSEIFMYCWFGNKVQVKSNLIAYAVFESDWTCLPAVVKRNLMIYTLNVLKPVKVSAFNLFDLSLDTFKRIIKTAWSYFTLLSQLSNN